MPPARRRVLLLFGGRSSEHEVSCVSAGNVLAALDRESYDVVPVGITAAGRWVLAADDPSRLRIVDGRLPSVDPAGPAVVLSADPARPVLLPAGSAGDPREVDVAFPLLHGPYGEDGTVQGLLEIAGLPYVGSGVLASALAMDKEFMKLTLAAHGLPVGAWQVVRRGEWRRAAGAVAERLGGLGLPLFVKPARGGSSIGISRVDEPAALAAAVEQALAHDDKAVVEAAVRGREVECGVLAGGDDDDDPQASPPAEIHVPAGRFYDFAAKYLEDTTRFDVPAQLPPGVTEQVRASAVAAFRALGCAGLARVDFFVRPDGTLVVNEVNTMPGFTAASMFPRMWAAAGVSYPQLVDRLLDSAGR